jgi:glutaryl-CoA dehydrogenase
MNVQKIQSHKAGYSPPPPEGDFYRISEILDDSERAVLKRVRDFMDREVAPIIEDYWVRDQFPFDLVPKIAALGIGGVGFDGYGSAGGSMLLNGFLRYPQVSSRCTPCLGAHPFRWSTLVLKRRRA